jgi:hypothetical protein
MIVVHASAAVDWLLQTSSGKRIEKRIYARSEFLTVLCAVYNPFRGQNPELTGSASEPKNSETIQSSKGRANLELDKCVT